jgi:hypothetical protein
MTPIKLTPQDLLISLEEQLYFLDTSISNYSQHRTIKKYDNKVIGNTFHTKILSEIEAKRIATTVRVLIHDTKNSSSLIGQLGLKNKLHFLDTASKNDGRLHSMTNMHGVHGSNTNQYLGLVAKINTGDSLIATPLYIQNSKEWYDSYKRLVFDIWWNNVVIDTNGNKHTRKDLILNAANKDGGAHIDSELPNHYNLTKNTNLCLNIKGIETEFERNIVYASIAQIGWEILNSIEYDETKNGL